MDTLLDNQFIIVQEGYDSEDSIEKASQWIKEGKILRPSGNLSTLNRLQPGMYKVEITRDYGLHCKQIVTSSDKLFTFSNSVIQDLLNEINTFWAKKDLYLKNNLMHKRGILLEGFPGNGKSSIISLLSDEIIKRKGVVFRVSGPANLPIYVDFLVNSFREIEPTTPVISIIEDIDKYEDTDDLLEFLDGKLAMNHHVVIATTNDTTQIPDAFLRPSRLDLKLVIEYPDASVRREYFINKGVPEEDLDALVEASSNKLSLADLKEIYTSIYLLDYTMEEAVDKVTQPRTKKDYNFQKRKKAKLGV